VVFTLAGIVFALLAVVVAVVAPLGFVADAGGTGRRGAVLVALLIPGLAALLLAVLVRAAFLLLAVLSRRNAQPLARGIAPPSAATETAAHPTTAAAQPTSTAHPATAAHPAAGQGHPRNAQTQGGCQQHCQKYFAFHGFVSPLSFCWEEPSIGQDTLPLPYPFRRDSGEKVYKKIPFRAKDRNTGKPFTPSFV
jgi:hypothetical protein